MRGKSSHVKRFGESPRQSYVSRFTGVEHAAAGLGLQFCLDSLEEGLHLKGLLKRAVGAQHFGDVEKIENTDHFTAAGDRDDFHVREFPPQRGGSLQTILLGHENVHNHHVGGREPILQNGLLPITRFRDMIAGLLQYFANQLAELVFVIDDKNRWHRAWTSVNAVPRAGISEKTSELYHPLQ